MERSTLSNLQALSEEMGLSEEEVICRGGSLRPPAAPSRANIGGLCGGDLSREDTIEQVGIDWVEMADRQREAVEADVEWALK